MRIEILYRDNAVYQKKNSFLEAIHFVLDSTYNTLFLTTVFISKTLKHHGLSVVTDHC